MKRNTEPSSRKGIVLSERSKSTAVDLHSAGQRHADGLWTQRIDRAQPAMVGIRVGVVEQVDGIARSSLPGEDLEESIAFNVDDGFIVGDPADGVVQQAQQIAVTGEPEGAFDVSRKVGEAAGADFAQHDGWLIGVRGRRDRPIPEDNSRSQEQQ